MHTEDNNKDRAAMREEILKHPLADVPEFCFAFYDVPRNSAYALVKAGQLPTMRVGKRIKVIVAEAVKPLGIRPNF
ncbi:hypothetical protein [Agrobacterium vitis]|uniref:hypothetical protein n=1 Tax=Agrobacterium vitis TaxID=373 RepID=UPI0015723262|nr:hypothetical protein [Agrobacterium vitis]NSZ19332.1 helix-turn-helix domain-containing protein [Agrobacterium vitis]QZO06200.1 hypothetical protein K4831_21365 [Agrobacterium vitis]UJL90523.1 hypothetical protein AVF2S5_21400 [Agrobacterium vitis]